MSRLRRALGAEMLASRPYRLRYPVTSDIDAVFDALVDGNVWEALTNYAGPLLPRSDSPAVADLRSELASTLRDAVLAADDISLLRRWLQLLDARYDEAAWRALRARARAPYRSFPTIPQAHGHH